MLNLRQSSNRAAGTFILSLASTQLVAAASAPWSVAWQNASVGPDGPWNALFIPVDNSPTQDLTLLPSLTETLIIGATSCSNQSATCPLPTPSTLWTSSSAHESFLWMNSQSWDVSTWDDIAEPLRLEGEAIWIHETITLTNPATGISQALYDQGVALTSDFTVTYPGGQKYTMDVGFFSLYGGSQAFSWTSTNGSTISMNRQLPAAYNQSIIPSNSYGIHVGAASQNVSGSLVLGGYDRSRCLTSPIITSSSAFELSDIGIGVETGGSAFLGTVNGSASGLLKPSSSTGLTVKPNPGVPYLYLPQDTCDAIASHLPVTFNPDLGLYTWNTDDPAFSKIVNSPSYLSFTFKSSGDNNTIYVPFALLNLTLESPIVNSATQYFPCSPYSPSAKQAYHLGRAFLQAAFLAKNWATDTIWLAQAPGPDTPPIQVTTISPSDNTLAAMINAPSWYDTWSGTLEALPSSSTPSATATVAPGSSSSGSISGGAIAGIVVGVLAAIAIIVAVLLFLRRRRRTGKRDSTTELTQVRADSRLSSQHEAGSENVFEAPYSPVHEISGGENGINTKVFEKQTFAEAEGLLPPSELPGSTPSESVKHH